MKLLSAEWTDNWSWGLVVDSLLKHIPGLEVERRFKGDMRNRDYDVMICQQVTLFKNWLAANNKIITRLGGNMTFEDMESSAAKFYLDKMRQCYAVIATNRTLYDIGKRVNPRTYLVPNGIDLDEWTPPKEKPRNKNFIAGFVGNIENPQYRRYKGYDYARDAVNALSGFQLRRALRGDLQIPHDRMKEDFYWEIDCLVHPTAGEGCSNALMEACACGVPIITTRCAGFHGELMENRRNVLFCERSEESIRECLVALYEDSDLRERLSSGSREFAEKHHDIMNVAMEYRRIIEECHKDNQVNCGNADREDEIIKRLDEIIILLKKKVRQS